MEELEHLQSFSPLFKWLRPIVLTTAGVAFFFSMGAASFTYSVASLLVPVSISIVVDIYEDLVYAKLLRGQVERLTDTPKAHGRINEAESENKKLCTRNCTATNTGRRMDSVVGEGSVGDAIAASVADDQTIEIRIRDDQLRDLRTLESALRSSLSDANECVAKLHCIQERTTRDLNAAQERMLGLENYNQHLCQENHRLRHELDDALTIINDNLQAAKRSNAGCGEKSSSNAVIVAQHDPQTTPCQPQPSITTTITATQTPSAASDNANTIIEKVQGAAVSMLSHDGVDVRDYAHDRIRRRRYSALSMRSDANSLDPSFEEDLQAARVELIIKRRVYKKVELAFEVCRKQGRFGEEAQVTTDEKRGSGGTEKVRIDSLTGIQEILKEIGQERGDTRTKTKGSDIGAEKIRCVA